METERRSQAKNTRVIQQNGDSTGAIRIVDNRANGTRKNETGLPDNLKAGVESLSGFSLDNVRVHYNSSKPATVQALAYTQGTDIHVAPGQEKHLPHEAWHVAQQMAGRVSPTTNINGMPVNDNAALEHEADVMGEKALQRKPISALTRIEHEGDVAQRVIQREGEANGKFKYVADFYSKKEYLARIPFDYKAIHFADYKKGMIKSANFSGCFMLAFHFNGTTIDPTFVTSIRSTTDVRPDLSPNKKYVAHVDSSVKTAVFDAERRGLITIEALFRPADRVTIDKNIPIYAAGKRLGFHFTRYPQSPSGLGDLTGGMTYSKKKGWSGAVYLQERIPLGSIDDRKKYKWENSRLVKYNKTELGRHTEASMAYICATVLLDPNITPDERTAADARLRGISRESIELALNEIVLSERDVTTIGKLQEYLN